MSKFNTSTARARNGISVIENTNVTAVNHKGGIGVVRSAKSELFLAVVSDFGNEATFYETADNRSARISKLARQVAVEDPEWVTNLINWLRNEGNMRSISLIVALESAKALIDAKIPGGRKVIVNSIARADEPGEALAYWFANYGRKLPAAVKRGIADGATKTYNEYALGKYDTASKGFRFADVIQLVHPTPTDARQSDVFKFALDRQRDNSAVPAESLTLLANRKAFLALSKAEKRKIVTSENGSAVLKAAGLTWENIGGEIGLDAEIWQALIPTMGYMALLRNLRNFEEAGVSAKVLDEVATRLADPEQVAKSRQLPFRFLSAYRATGKSLRFGYPLEKALNASLANVPSLSGNTLVLVDRSGSMFYTNSEKTDMTFADTGALFGTALALRANKADLVEFGDSYYGKTGSRKIDFTKSSSVLPLVDSFTNMGGTDTIGAVRRNYNGHDRVIIITDEQHNSYSDPTSAIPSNIPVYTFNLAGYRTGQGASKPNRTYFGGLTDQSFALIKNLEAGLDGNWPWETK